MTWKSFNYFGVCYSSNKLGAADCFSLNIEDMNRGILELPHNFPQIRNVKNNIQKHIKTYKFYKQKVEEKKEVMKSDMKYKSRTTTVELDLFSLRYNGLRKHEPRPSFEEDIMTAKLNGTDVGDINHSRCFA